MSVRENSPLEDPYKGALIAEKGNFNAKLDVVSRVVSQVRHQQENNQCNTIADLVGILYATKLVAEVLISTSGESGVVTHHVGHDPRITHITNNMSRFPTDEWKVARQTNVVHNCSLSVKKDRTDDINIDAFNFRKHGWDVTINTSWAHPDLNTAKGGVYFGVCVVIKSDRSKKVEISFSSGFKMPYIHVSFNPDGTGRIIFDRDDYKPNNFPFSWGEGFSLEIPKIQGNSLTSHTYTSPLLVVQKYIAKVSSILMSPVVTSLIEGIFEALDVE